MQTLQSILSGRVKTATLHSLLSGRVKLAAGPAWYQDPKTLAPIIGGGLGMLGGAGIGGLLGGGNGALIGGLGGGAAGAGLGYLGRDHMNRWFTPKPQQQTQQAQQQTTPNVSVSPHWSEINDEQKQDIETGKNDMQNALRSMGAEFAGASAAAYGIPKVVSMVSKWFSPVDLGGTATAAKPVAQAGAAKTVVQATAAKPVAQAGAAAARNARPVVQAVTSGAAKPVAQVGAVAARSAIPVVQMAEHQALTNLAARNPALAVSAGNLALGTAAKPLVMAAGKFVPYAGVVLTARDLAAAGIDAASLYQLEQNTKDYLLRNWKPNGSAWQNYWATNATQKAQDIVNRMPAQQFEQFQKDYYAFHARKPPLSAYDRRIRSHVR